MLTLNHNVKIPEDVLFHQAVDESVLLSPDGGKYFSLDDIGTRMWLLMNEHGHLGAVHEALLDEYQVDPLQLEQDLLSLAERLVANELLQICEP